jgi:hypothetical protein
MGAETVRPGGVGPSELTPKLTISASAPSLYREEADGKKQGAKRIGNPKQKTN